MKRLAAIGVAAVFAATGARAQVTQVYAYDGNGRLRSAGSSANASTTYQLDGADNRTSRTSGPAVGWRILGDGFDPYFYLLFYPDIRNADADPYAHWLAWGAGENRQPNRFFDTTWYRTTYGLASNVNPLTDYHTTGWQAGRNPSPEFSTSLYLAAYPDVAASGIDPLWHYLVYGLAEGRSRFPVQ